MRDDCLDEETRAEDILLGSLGFGEDSSIVSIEKTDSGYRGMGRFSDGEEFQFQSEWELEELEQWALEILLKKFNKK